MPKLIIADTDGKVPEDRFKERLTETGLKNNFDHSGAVPADTQVGASVAAKITAASLNAPEHVGLVNIPASMAVNTDRRARTTDLVVGPERLIVDWRNEYGTITNHAVRGALQLTKLFGDNNINPPEAESDSGAVLAVDCLLTGGSGTRTPPVYGENVALYAGIQRQVGSTRNAWAANFLLTSYEPVDIETSTYGLEIDLSNNGGTDATDSTPFDGISLFAAGTNDSRFGIWIANSGTAQWLKGIMISSQISGTGIEISSGIPIGLHNQSPTRLESNLTMSSGNTIYQEGNSAAYSVIGEFGAHQWYAHGTSKNPMTLESNGRLTLKADDASTTPTIQVEGPSANHGLNIGPKGAGVLNLYNIPTTTTAPAAGAAGALPASPAEYATVYFNGVARKVALY